MYTHLNTLIGILDGGVEDLINLVRRFATCFSARPLIDNILFEGRIDFVFWMHEH